MRREAFFLKDPNQHVQFRLAQIRDLKARMSGDVAPDDRLALQLELAREHLFLTIAGYSRGDGLLPLRSWHYESMSWLHEFAQGGGTYPLGSREEYYLALWTLSLTFLLGYTDELGLRLAEDMSLQGKDAILDQLICSLQPELEPVGKLLYPEPYRHLFQALKAEGNKQAPFISQFLVQFYHNQKDCPWYDRHIKHEAFFFGYWTFELAALVKLQGWKDEGFADNLFYPRDLAGAQLFRTWQDDAIGEADRQAVDEMEAAADWREKAAQLGEVLRQQVDNGPEQAEQFVEQLTGLKPAEYAEQPEKLVTALKAMLQQILQATQGLKKAQEGDLEELAGIQEDIQALLEVEQEWALELPADLQSRPSAAVDTSDYDALEVDLRKIIDHDAERDPVDFLLELSMVMDRFAFLSEGEPDTRIQEKSEDENTRQLREKLNARGALDFSWKDLL